MNNLPDRIVAATDDRDISQIQTMANTPPPSVTRGWRWQPGLHRCDRGWNDTTGKSYGCREPGIRAVGPEWLCTKHADEIPDPIDVPHRGCRECRADAGLPPGLDGALGMWYWCPTCHEEWSEDHDLRPDPLPLGSLLFVVVMLIYISGLFVTLTMLAAWWLLPSFFTATDEEQVRAMLGGMGIAVIPWMIAIWFSQWAVNEVAWWSWRAWRYVWGEPLCAS